MQTLFQDTRNVDDNILTQNEMQLIQTVLHDNQNYHSSVNWLIIDSAIDY